MRLSPVSSTVLSLPLSCFRWVLRQLNGRTSTGARQATAALRPQCLIQVSGFQHPKTDYVLLGLQVRPVGEEHLAGPEFDKSSKKFCFFRALELGFAPGHLNIRIGF